MAENEQISLKISKSLFVIQHVLLEVQTEKKVLDFLKSVIPLVNMSDIKASNSECFGIRCILGNMLTYIPATTSFEARVSLASHFLSECSHYKRTDEAPEISFDSYTLDSETLANSLQLGPQIIVKAAVQASDFVECISNKYGFTANIQEPSWDSKEFERIFASFCKAEMLKTKDENPDFYFDLALVKTLPYYSSLIEGWVNGFYRPFVYLSNCTDIPSLNEFDSLLQPDAQIKLIMDTAIAKDSVPSVVTNVLVPFMKFRPSLTENVNNWLLNFAENTVKAQAKNDIVNDYRCILDIVRQDSFLKLMSRDKDNRDYFVTVIVSTIFLCPDTILEVLVDTKEIVVTLGTLNLEPGDPKQKIAYFKPTGVQDMANKLVPSQTLLKKCSKIIESGERLYENGLTLMQIVELSSSKSSKQLQQLHKYIITESNYCKTSKQWKTVLSSIYWVFKNTDIFGRVKIEVLDELILSRLLDLRYFDIVQQTFLKQYCSLPTDKVNKLLLTYAWRYHDHATNCDPTLGSLKAALNCVEIIDSSSTEAQRLHTLIKGEGKLLQWKLSFKPGVPVSPKQIVDIHDVNKIISRILEMNDIAYMESQELYELGKLLIKGLNCYDMDPLFESTRNPAKDDKLNPYFISIQLRCLDYASTDDRVYAQGLASNLLDSAIDNHSSEMFEVVSNGWISFFQFVKNDNELEQPANETALDRKLSLLGKIELVCPDEFDLPVLEYWQLLNTQRQQLINDNHEEQSQVKQSVQQESDPSVLLTSGLNDLRSRLKESLKSSASGIISKGTEANNIGRTIIGRIVGAE